MSTLLKRIAKRLRRAQTQNFGPGPGGADAKDLNLLLFYSDRAYPDDFAASEQADKDLAKVKAILAETGGVLIDSYPDGERSGQYLVMNIKAGKATARALRQAFPRIEIVDND